MSRSRLVQRFLLISSFAAPLAAQPAERPPEPARPKESADQSQQPGGGPQPSEADKGQDSAGAGQAPAPPPAEPAPPPAKGAPAPPAPPALSAAPSAESSGAQTSPHQAPPTHPPEGEQARAEQGPHPLPAIVVTELKVPQPERQVTQSVRVLYEDDIALRPTNQRNISEIIRYEPGVFVSPLSRNDANWGSYGGLGPKYNTYLLDGLPIDAFVDGMSLDPWAFERVESQRGPASVMYSNYLSADFAGSASPLAGTTNFIMRDRVDLGRTRLSIGGGSYRTLEGRAYHQNHAGDLHYFFGASYERSDYTNYGANPSWLNIQHDPAYDKSKIYGKVTYLLGRDDHKISLFAHHTSHVGNAGRRNRDFSHGYDTVNAAYSNQFTPAANDQLKVGFRNYDRRWGEDNYGQTDAAGQLVPNQLALREHDGVRQRILPADLTFNVPHLGESMLTVGADTQYAHYRTYAEPAGIRTTQNRASAWSVGVFAQEKVVIGQWVLRAGGRFSHLRNDYELISGGPPGLKDQSWDRPLWSAGARHNPWDEVAFYVNAGSSFIAPAAKSVAGTLLTSDVGVAGRNGQLPNPNLKPESGVGVDLGTEIRPARGLVLGARGFFNRVSDAIVENRVSQDPSQSQSVNAGRARALGGEASVDHHVAQPFSWFANFTGVSTTVSNSVDPDQDGAEIPFVPNWVANAGFALHLPAEVTVAAFANAVGRFYDSTSKSGRKSFGPFVVPNLRLEKTLPTTAYDLDFIVALNNVIDNKYDLPWQFRDPGFNGMGYVQVTTK